MKKQIIFWSFLMPFLFLFQNLYGQSDSYCPLVLERNSNVNTDEFRNQFYNYYNNIGTPYSTNTTNFVNPSKKRPIIGDFDGNGIDEILLEYHAFYIPSLRMYEYCSNTSDMPLKWLHYSSLGTLAGKNGWNTQTNDIYIAGNFDGGRDDELLCINPSNGWAKILKYVPTSNACTSSDNPLDWKVIWSNGGSKQIGWWIFSDLDYHYVGNFDGGNEGDELLFMNPKNGYWQLYDFVNGQVITTPIIFGNTDIPNTNSFRVKEVLTKDKAVVGKFLENEKRDVLFITNISKTEKRYGIIRLNDNNGSNQYFETVLNSSEKIGKHHIREGDMFFQVILI